MGYRGKGYSDGFCANMTAVYETLRTDPDTLIELIEGPDDICAAFPKDQPSHCENASVYKKDREIAARLGVKAGDSFRWKDVCAAVGQSLRPADIRVLCRDCRWQPYGLCEEGVAHMADARSLRELPDGTAG